MITQVLKTDRECRYEGIEDDIFPMDELISDKSLDYDLPTLVNKTFDYNSSIKLCNNIDEFKTKFYEKYPCLVGLNMKNILIAGGSVGNIIKKPTGYGSDSDVDFFVYGLSQEDANIRVKEWIIDIINCANAYKIREKEKGDKGKYVTTDCEMIRNNNTILIQICNQDFQLIFRLYKTKSEILHGFDLGSSAIGFDGDNVYLTSLGKFCYEHSCNIVDTTRRSTTYEYRLEKYFERGFNIVIPGLDKKQLRQVYFKYGLNEVCILPHFTFSYYAISGNKIRLTNFYNKYSETSDYKLDDINEYNSFRMNLYNLVNDINFFYNTSTSTDTTRLEILTKGPRLSKGAIVSYYETLRSKLNNKKVDVTLLKNFITIETPANVALNIIQNTDKTYLDNLIAAQTQLVLDKLAVLQSRDHTKINWIVKNPGTQLCGSFNPIFRDEKDWYGLYYNPNSHDDEINFKLENSNKNNKTNDHNDDYDNEDKNYTFVHKSDEENEDNKESDEKSNEDREDNEEDNEEDSEEDNEEFRIECRRI